MKLTCCKMLVVALIVGATSTVYAQQGGGFGGGFGGFDTSLFLLRDEAVQKELELVPEQQEKLRKIGEDMREEMQGMFSGLRDLNAEERTAKFAELREKMQDAQKKMKEEVNDILLPQQRDRLAQIQFQSQSRRSGSTGGLTGGSVVEALGISEAQLEEMKKKEEEVRESLAKKIAEAQKEARDELLSVLTPAQRKKYDELMGQPFEFQQRQGFQGRQGGDRGNRGGGDRDGDRGDRPET